MYTQQLESCRKAIEQSGGIIIRIKGGKDKDFFSPPEIKQVFFSFAYSPKLFRRDLVSSDRTALQRARAFAIKAAEVILRNRGQEVDICLLVEATNCYLIVSLFPLIESINQKKEVKTENHIST